MALGGAVAILGGVELVGAATGGRDALDAAGPPWRGGGASMRLTFTRVKTVEQLDADLPQRMARR